MTGRENVYARAFGTILIATSVLVSFVILNPLTALMVIFGTAFYLLVYTV